MEFGKKGSKETEAPRLGDEPNRGRSALLLLHLRQGESCDVKLMSRVEGARMTSWESEAGKARDERRLEGGLLVPFALSEGIRFRKGFVTIPWPSGKLAYANSS
jgi:hypothetical protein